MKMYVLYLYIISVTYGCHFQVWQNHIKCLLKEVVTQLFPVSISHNAEKIQLHSPAVAELHSGKHVFLILLLQQKCGIKCLIKWIYYLCHFSRSTSLAVLLNNSHHMGAVSFIILCSENVSIALSYSNLYVIIIKSFLSL